MPRRILTVSQKLAILEEAEQTGSIEMTERQQKLQKIQLMDWGVNKEKLIEKLKLYRKAHSIHPGPIVENQEIELQVLEWVHVREITDYLQKCYK